MREDPVHELRELVDSLSDWLRYQRRLGWRGVPGKVAAQIKDNAQPYEPTLEEIRAEMGDCRFMAAAPTWYLGTGLLTPG
jgi:hypothetical protein